MFSIENLLSSKYSPKPLQRCGEGIGDNTTKDFAEDGGRMENLTERESESHSGKRDTAYLKMSALSDRHSEREGEGAEEKGMVTGQVARGRKRPSEGDSDGESCSCDEGKT